MVDHPDVLSQISSYVTEIISGTFFLLFGLTTFAIAIIRSQKNTRVLFWLGMWSATYGIGILISCPPVNISLPLWLQTATPLIDVAIRYLILFFALLTWLEFTRHGVHQFLKINSILSLIIAISGISAFWFTGNKEYVMAINQLLATITLIVLIVVLLIKPLAERYLILPGRRLLALATLIFAAEALYTNIARVLDWPAPSVTGWLGFAVLLAALALSAVQIIYDSEKRLLNIENELATARKIQLSILPAPFPSNNRLNIAAAYHPMTAVAGDFYDYMVVDDLHCGFLVADVSGHGVPAALIASMVKIAFQSAGDVADDPPNVLKHLSRALISQLQEQFVTAAYLYIDLVNNKVRYSAAGHPPLLYFDDLKKSFDMIESNGMLISPIATADYPLYEWDIDKGDRFLLYTDGLTEAENRSGEQFSEKKLDRLLSVSGKLTATELSSTLYDALQEWQANPTDQQDDFTWIVIDVI